MEKGMLFINARILTMEQENFDAGFLLIKDKKIAGVGSMSDLSNSQLQAEQTVDVKGATILPGMIDAHTHIGMWEDSIGFEGDDGNEETDPCTPHLRAIDGVNPRDRCFEDARSAGVTTVVISPGSANPIGGQMILTKTAGARIDDMVLKAPFAMKFALGENPKSVYNKKNQQPSTRMATASIIREQLHRAKQYMSKLGRAHTGKESGELAYDIKCEALIPVLRREIQAHFHAHRADDIFTAIRIAKEFDLDYVIIHCTEGHLIAKELAAARICAIVGPSFGDRFKPELTNLTFQTPGILSRENILCSITTDHSAVPIQYLPLCASLAVKEGMPEEKALRAITLDAAAICGVDDRVGSLQAGKDADFSVWSGHPFDFNAVVAMTVIDGEIVYRRA
jgi:imidazolonepropionase-like amidohydrolase